jgi:hypothetical protein
MLVELIPRVLAEEQAETRRSGGWRPRCSSAGTERCIRKEVYKAVGYPAKPFSGRTLLIFDDGEWHEELTIDKLQRTAMRVHSQQMALNPVYAPDTHRGYHCGVCEEADPKCSAETPCPNRGPGCPHWVEADTVHGHIDGIVTDPLGQDYLFEHKSANCWSWDRWANGAQIPWDYVTQCAMYVYGLRKEGSNVERAILLIKNKNNSAYLEFIVECPIDTLDPEKVTRIVEGSFMEGDRAVPIKFDCEVERANLITDAVERYCLIADLARRQELPSRPLPMGHFQCGWCEFADPCWEGYITTAKDLADDPSVEAEGELRDLIITARSLKDLETDSAKTYKTMSNDIKVAMANSEQRNVHVTHEDGSRFNAALSIRSRKGLNEEVIPDDIVAKARTVTTYEQLDIRKAKPPKAKKARKKKP